MKTGSEREKEKVRVLIVDDSALVRQTLEKILSTDREIEVVGTAADPFIAAQKIQKTLPDVISLDVEMPRMDGLTFLKKIMSQYPIPVVICSALTEKGAETTLKAMEYGAVDIITKPRLGATRFFQETQTLLCDTIKAAAKARLKNRDYLPLAIEPKLTADAVLMKAASKALIRTTEKVVVAGASTGGTEAIREFLEALPPDAPGIVIVQHMPEQFTKAFAKRLDGLCKVTVKEAEDGDSIIPGRVLIAPGNRHTMLDRSGAKYLIKIGDGPLVNRHRPSIDVLFRSAAKYAGKNAIGIIMTGMGDDGARGLLEMKEAGAFTIAQDEETSVVFGMPWEAIKLRAVHEVLPLPSIAGKMLQECSKSISSKKQDPENVRRSVP